ncbi:MAG TPA: hypothetical protein VNM14_18655 [Planctomycetota bacterium]|nr:hypothetical protein [Planctomycetota bacterium]
MMNTPQAGSSCIGWGLLLSLLLSVPGSAQQGSGPDVNEILKKADKILDESKAAYEEAREKSSVEAFVNAGFKLEEARIKYIVLQEIGTPELQKLSAERLRTVNQLGKLIHDGKVAITGAPADAPVVKAPEPAPGEPPAKPEDAPAKPLPTIKVRLPIPEAAKQREAEKLVRELLKDQYAKKAAADRQALARNLLEMAGKSAEDPAALWVLYREAQEVATQACDVKAAIQALDGAASDFDIDVLPQKSTTLLALSKNAKSPDDAAALIRALLVYSDDCVAVDQYDLADKAMSLAAQQARKANDPALTARSAIRSKEVAEAKSRYQAMKSVLETLAKTPDDPSANNEMGQFLCFVKGNWDLGLRFLVRGSDATLKALSQKELALPTQAAELAALGDGWWDLSEKDKSPLRKGQLQAHARQIYSMALATAPPLLKMKIEKRMEGAEPQAGAQASPAGAINLMQLIDVSKDFMAGTWTLKNGKLSCDAKDVARIEIPYEPPAEYDFRIVFSRTEGSGDVVQLLTKNNHQFAWVMGSNSNSYMGFALINNQWVSDPGSLGGVPMPGALTNNRTYTSLVQVRKDGVKGFVDGKLIKEYKTSSYEEMTPNGVFAIRSTTILGLGSWYSGVAYHKVELVEVTGKGKRTR